MIRFKKLLLTASTYKYTYFRYSRKCLHENCIIFHVCNRGELKKFKIFLTERKNYKVVRGRMFLVNDKIASLLIKYLPQYLNVSCK